MNELPKRKHIRLSEYDYSQNGAYFITICTKDRRRLLSQISTVGAGVLDRPSVKLLPHGVVADQYIRQMNDFYDWLCVDAYVIMPNHIHLLLRIENGRSGTPAPTKGNALLERFVSTFKRFCNREYGENIWQRSFHDHVIRDQADYDEVYRYIENNPTQWELDELYAD